jgi:hypothetical protein
VHWSRDGRRGTIADVGSSYFGVNLASTDLGAMLSALESDGAEVVQDPADQPFVVRDRTTGDTE